MNRYDLDDFLEALPALETGALLELTAAHGAIDLDTLEAARAAVEAAARRAHRTNDIDRLRDDITRWATTPNESARWTAAMDPADLFSADVRRGAAAALVDVASALLLGGALDSAARECLLGAWRRGDHAGP